MNLEQILQTQMKDDYDVVAPFIARLIKRLHDKHPNEHIELKDVELIIEVNIPNAQMRIRKMLDLIAKEGLAL